jgi:hypothetical protein
VARAMVLAVVGSALLLGCGSGASAPVVASVQGSTISQRALSHWTGIKRAEQEGSSSTGAIPPAELERDALRFLITAEWLEKESAAQGVGVASSEVGATYQRLLSGPSGPAFAASLARRGLSSSDELLVLRLGALAQKLRVKIAAAHPGLPAAGIRGLVAGFIASYRERWRQRTTCQPRYAIAECRNGPALSPSPGSGP